jgi:hypothetical protein
MSTRRIAPLIVRAVVAGLVALVLGAGPAAADPPAPGDYSSRITAVDPPLEGVAIEVVGGDAFLEMVVDPGIEVVVLGYEGEPFARVRSDGTVEQNRRSPATYLNDDRYGRVDIPTELAGVDVTALEPIWDQVGDSGRYAWHDHRIHWMAPDAPPTVGRGEEFDWSDVVPLVVDGARHEVAGAIRYHETTSPLPWLAGGALLAVAAAVLLRGRSRVGAAVAAGAGVLASVVAWATWDLAPAGVGASPLPLIAAVAAAVLGVAALAAPARVRPLVLLAAAATLGSWGLLRFGVLTNPVLPTSLPFAIDRAATAAAIAVAVGVVVATFGDLGPARDRTKVD